MNGLIRWMAGNHVASNLLMMTFIVGGLIMGISIKQEVFPEITLDKVQISVAYPGAGPEEVEEGVVLKIEENVSGIEGVKEVKSVAAEGVGFVTVDLIPGEDVDQVLQDVKAEVDRITTFPLEAEKPIITKIANRQEVVYVAVYGDVPERSLREYAEAISDDLQAMPGITQTELAGVRPYEISVEVPEENLRRHNLTLDAIAARVRHASIDLPAGAIKSAGGEILVRTKEKRYQGHEFSGITVLENPDGTQVRLKDIAQVRDTFRETDEFSTFDGKPAAMVAVYRVGEQKPTLISEAVKAYVEKKRASLPPSVSIATLNDRSELLKSRMNLLIKNALLGLVLVFIVLGLFLQIRLALWVMLGIPISFMGAMLLLPGLDVSINMLSLFAFILALGIVVDDAIVVGENVFEHRNAGIDYKTAAVKGATEVSRPVIFSILTTVATFVPLTFVEGTMGKFIRTIPLVVIPILLVSLVEALLILPAHLSGNKAAAKTRGPAAAIERVRVAFGRKVDWFIRKPYNAFLGICLRNRYATVAGALAIILMAAGVVGGGLIKFRFMPEVDGDFVIASLKMPIGTPVEDTTAAQELLLVKAREVVAEYDARRDDGISVLRNIYAIVGGKVRQGQIASGETSGAHVSEVSLVLTPSEKRKVASVDITRDWRKSVGDVPGAESLTFSSNVVRFGANIDVRIAHDDTETLLAAASRIKTALEKYPGVGDIADNYSRGKKEIKLRLRPEARTLGITEEDLGRQVRGALFGSEALRFQRGKNEVKVMVRYPEEERRMLSSMERMRIRTPQGGEVPFSMAAYAEQGRGYSEINRADRKRVINITASVDNKVANAEEIITEVRDTVLEDLIADFPGLSYNLEGEDKERRDSLDSMKRGFTLALFAIYALLAIPLRSYSQPLIIMSAIPFGFVGAVLGHILLGFNLSILSMFGLVALSGVVVNDSLLLIDYANRRRADGAGAMEAITDAGKRRFRPIILTSLTTSCGLTPMILETSVQAQFLIPMAISLGTGILFATFITLLLIPALYLIVEDLKGARPEDTAHAAEGGRGTGAP